MERLLFSIVYWFCCWGWIYILYFVLYGAMRCSIPLRYPFYLLSTFENISAIIFIFLIECYVSIDNSRLLSYSRIKSTADTNGYACWVSNRKNERDETT